MAIRKMLVAASFGVALLLAARPAHSQNPQSRGAAGAPKKAKPPNKHPAAASAPANAATGEDAATLRAQWARVVMATLRSLSDLERFTLSAIAAQHDDPVAAALQRPAVPPASTAAQPGDAPQIRLGIVRATVVRIEPVVHAASDGRGEHADLPGLAVRIPP